MSQMLHTKLQGPWLFGSGKQDFKVFFFCFFCFFFMGVAAILVMWPRCGEQTFVPPIDWGFCEGFVE